MSRVAQLLNAELGFEAKAVFLPSTILLGDPSSTENVWSAKMRAVASQGPAGLESLALPDLLRRGSPRETVSGWHRALFLVAGRRCCVDAKSHGEGLSG